uniref:Uncharacterized protein n=1 Tax=Rhizophora mucronata TaxID=61149 RepID=A0A2P2PRE4_RHIMU
MAGVSPFNASHRCLLSAANNKTGTNK